LWDWEADSEEMSRAVRRTRRNCRETTKKTSGQRAEAGDVTRGKNLNDDDPAVSQQLEEIDVEMPQTGSSIMMLDPVL
jgi:hypothetical protein